MYCGLTKIQGTLKKFSISDILFKFHLNLNYSKHHLRILKLLSDANNYDVDGFVLSYFSKSHNLIPDSG